MIETVFADGLGTGLGEKVAMFAIKCLAVAGGGFIGYVVGWLIAKALNRWVFAYKAPEPLKKAVAIVCGIALAILIALIVFGEGGGGLFGGGGGSAGDGKGSPPAEDKGKQTAPLVKPKEDQKTPPIVDTHPAPSTPTPGDVRIGILAGAQVRDGKFYLLDNESTPKTLDELSKAVAERRKNTKDSLIIVYRFTKEPLSSTHPEMKRFQTWIQESKLASRFE